MVFNLHTSLYHITPIVQHTQLQRVINSIISYWVTKKISKPNSSKIADINGESGVKKKNLKQLKLYLVTVWFPEVSQVWFWPISFLRHRFSWSTHCWDIYSFYGNRKSCNVLIFFIYYTHKARAVCRQQSATLDVQHVQHWQCFLYQTPEDLQHFSSKIVSTFYHIYFIWQTLLLKVTYNVFKV